MIDTWECIARDNDKQIDTVYFTGTLRQAKSETQKIANDQFKHRYSIIITDKETGLKGDNWTIEN